MILILIQILVNLLIFSQTFSQENTNLKEKTRRKELTAFSGYRGVKLGMNWNQVMTTLKKDSLLHVYLDTKYGALDEMFPIIKAEAKPFVRVIYYQFTHQDDTKYAFNISDQDLSKWILYAVTIHFNKQYEDYYSLYQLIYQKYGQANKHHRNYIKWKLNNSQLETKNRDQLKMDQTEKKNSLSNDSAFSIILTRPATIQILKDDILLKRGNQNLLRRFNILKTYEQNVRNLLLKDFLSPNIEKKEGD